MVDRSLIGTSMVYLTPQWRYKGFTHCNKFNVSFVTRASDIAKSQIYNNCFVTKLKPCQLIDKNVTSPYIRTHMRLYIHGLEMTADFRDEDVAATDEVNGQRSNAMKFELPIYQGDLSMRLKQ
jgi:hypothetical protein